MDLKEGIQDMEVVMKFNVHCRHRYVRRDDMLKEDKEKEDCFKQ